jgi:hypothetical protein
MVVTKDKEVFLLIIKHFMILNIKIKKQSAIELMGYKVVKKVLIYIGKGIDVVNL